MITALILAVTAAMPNPQLTPGVADHALTKEKICVKGYAKGARNVSSAEKKQVYAAYGIAHHSAKRKGKTVSLYEIDHLISLELGGTNDIRNLWPELYDPRPNAHEKDIVENYLHAEVCRGDITLEEAQREISTDWLKVYKAMPSKKRVKAAMHR